MRLSHPLSRKHAPLFERKNACVQADAFAHAARLRPLQLAAERGGGGGEERRAFFSAADAAAAAATVARERFAGGALRSTNGPPANKRVSVEFRFGGALADAPAIDGRARDAEGAAGEEDE